MTSQSFHRYDLLASLEFFRETSVNTHHTGELQFVKAIFIGQSRCFRIRARTRIYHPSRRIVINQKQLKAVGISRACLDFLFLTAILYTIQPFRSLYTNIDICRSGNIFGVV